VNSEHVSPEYSTVDAEIVIIKLGKIESAGHIGGKPIHGLIGDRKYEIIHLRCYKE
jgi:hypothetical protein